MDEKSAKSKKIILDILILIIGLSIGYAIIFFALGLGDTWGMTLHYIPDYDSNNSTLELVVLTEDDFQKYPALKEAFLTRDTNVDTSDPEKRLYEVNFVVVQTRQQINEIREYILNKVFYWEGGYYSAIMPIE
ncbi:hypothetical protein Mlab_1729 [Methanocorpusculum labreanum Z]|jgi:hypothetical protein|uniref:Uncharacterized protein n=1 Tax=Methanocorpusculum labreanum (strain ATCC 43576 / DSM 4855 / Z) TaxID=410358 RepID=A2SU84_METLZ|nr:hypothetical protein [Methanocorpusculum labreanum]ABN07890.1 hypothetical protein Mlab_1729 [Methanocorpusculum labreanum Z]